MPTDYTEQIAEALAQVREQQEQMAKAAAELRAATASATSKDRLVTAKVGPQGQVLSLTFHTTAYRAMAPAELAAILVDTLNRARADIGERVTQSMKSFAGLGEALRSSLVGGSELDEVLAPLQAMRPVKEQPVRIVVKQEEFDA